MTDGSEARLNSGGDSFSTRALREIARWTPEPLKPSLRRLRRRLRPVREGAALDPARVSAAPATVPSDLPGGDDPRLMRFLASGAAELVSVRAGTRVVRRVSPQPWEVAEANRAIAIAALESAAARYFDVGESGALRSTLAVPEPDWLEVLAKLEAVKDQDPEHPIYVELEGDFGVRTFLLGFITLDDEARSAAEVRVYQLLRRRERDRLWGFEARAQLQRWDSVAVRPAHGQGADAADRVVLYAAPTVNGYLSTVADSRITTRDVTEWGRTRRRLEPALPTVRTPQGPVDVVYLWVDGSDPAWYARMMSAKGLEVDAHSHDKSRFRDRGELRHSMRSLMLNVPWINHIYLVTDRQTPAWLDLSSDRITLVDHREIFSDTATLPTFNSHAIGSRLHHIPGISERYLLMNDDVFFNRPAAPDLFFTGAGGIVVPLSRTAVARVPREMMSPIDTARENSARLVERDYGRWPTQLFRHTPVPQLKSLMQELEDRYPDVFSHLESSQFRSHDDHVVNSWLHHYTALMTGRGTPGRYDYRYINLASESGWAVLNALSPSSKTVTFCINDVGDGEAGDESHMLEKWLSEYFPEPSELELKDRSYE